MSLHLHFNERLLTLLEGLHKLCATETTFPTNQFVKLLMHVFETDVEGSEVREAIETTRAEYKDALQDHPILGKACNEALLLPGFIAWLMRAMARSSGPREWRRVWRRFWECERFAHQDHGIDVACTLLGRMAQRAPVR